MKRTIVFLVVLVFTFMFFPPVEATVFKKGDKAIDKRTGDVYEFQYKADIGIYSADSGLGDLFIINGKVYAITPQGVMGMKAVSERTDVQAKLNATLKRYRSKKAEAARAWKALAAEKAKPKDLEWNYDDSEWHYWAMLVRKKDLKLQYLEAEIAELKGWNSVAVSTLVLTKSSLAETGKFLEEQDRKLHRTNAYIIILLCFIPIMYLIGFMYARAASRKIAKPTEEMETTDLTDLV